MSVVRVDRERRIVYGKCERCGSPFTFHYSDFVDMEIEEEFIQGEERVICDACYNQIQRAREAAAMPLGANERQ
jgi:hypothetical protein